MKKSIIILGSIIIVGIVLLILFSKMNYQQPQESNQQTENKNQITAPFDTNDNLDQSLEDLNSVSK